MFVVVCVVVLKNPTQRSHRSSIHLLICVMTRHRPMEPTHRPLHSTMNWQSTALRMSAAHQSPLQYMKKQSSDYPLLSQVARRLLAISATSAQSKLNFSSVGRTVTEARARVSVTSIQTIVYIVITPRLN